MQIRCRANCKTTTSTPSPRGTWKARTCCTSRSNSPTGSGSSLNSAYSLAILITRSLWNAGLQKSLSMCSRCTMPFWRARRLRSAPYPNIPSCQAPPFFGTESSCSFPCLFFLFSVLLYVPTMRESITCPVLAKCLDVVDKVLKEIWFLGDYIFHWHRLFHIVCNYYGKRKVYELYQIYKPSG